MKKFAAVAFAAALAFATAIPSIACEQPPLPDPDVWMTVTVGNKTRGQVLADLEMMFVSEDIVEAVRRPREIWPQPKPVEAHLKKISVKDLGFTNWPGVRNVFNKVTESHGGPLTLEMAVAIATQHPGILFHTGGGILVTEALPGKYLKIRKTSEGTPQIATFDIVPTDGPRTGVETVLTFEDEVIYVATKQPMTH